MGFDRTGIDELLNAAVEDGTVHGVVAMVVDQDGVLYEGVAGEADRSTVFRNASMTKAVATTGALQLVEEGRLELDQTVESVLPEFAELKVSRAFTASGPSSAPRQPSRRFAS